MYFMKNLAAATVALAATAMAQEYTISLNTTQSGLDVNSLGNTGLVSYANSSIWIGAIKSSVYSEPFLVQGDTGFSFTSWHSVPTGWQDLYIFPDETQPVQFTIPHAGSIPQGAATSGFAWTANGLTYNGDNKFIGCADATAGADTYKIYWAGAGAPAGASCTGTLYFYKFGSGTGCSTVG